MNTPMQIAFDRYSLILDGKRAFIRSGAMHYFRLPHPTLWWDRLNKLKMAGYNTVDLYFSWDFHSAARGQYYFNGSRDIAKLLDMVAELGLYLIARPGPYINAETTRGGLPGWLLSEPDVVLRNREDGHFVLSERYMQFVHEWFDHILPFLNNRPNLLMIQVENEYSTHQMEPEYFQTLIAWIREHGITVPTMHNDFYAAGLYEDIVDLYAIDNYSVTGADLNWRDFGDEVFSIIDHLEAQLRPDICANRPLIVAELQAGWFAGWKGPSYAEIAQSLGRNHIGLVTRSFLAQGGTVFNHYKAVGGTNWDYLGATDVCTSYDFTAPISEEGLPTERLYEAKRINLLLAHFNLLQTDAIQPEEMGLPSDLRAYRLRREINGQGTWIFTRNMTPVVQEMTLGAGQTITTLPYEAKMLPYQLPLESGWQLQFSNVEPLIQTKNMLVLGLESGLTVDFELPSLQDSPLETHLDVSWTHLGNNTYRLQFSGEITPDALIKLSFSGFILYLLGPDYRDRLWQVDDFYLLGPDMVVSSSEWYQGSSHASYQLDAIGLITPLSSPNNAPIVLPELIEWQCYALPVPDQDAPFQWLSSRGADMDANGIHAGAVWYRYRFDTAQKLVLQALHNWAVLLNGEILQSGYDLPLYPQGVSPENAVTMTLPFNKLNASGQPNELLIYVESMGHNKGFYDDTREPRGVLSLTLDDLNRVDEGQILSLKNLQRVPLAEAKVSKAPMIEVETTFTLAIPDTALMPLGLQTHLAVNRINIKLNGIQVGQFWQDYPNQTVFYLPEGILNTQGENILTLTLIDFKTAPSDQLHCLTQKDAVTLVPYAQFGKIKAN